MDFALTTTPDSLKEGPRLPFFSFSVKQEKNIFDMTVKTDKSD